MKEIKGNVFDLAFEDGVDAICITTNSVVNYNGLAIMGAGVAGEAAKRWPSVRSNLGKALAVKGNLPFVIGILDKENKFQNPEPKKILNKEYKCLIWSFPTKHHFKNNSILDLIEKSTRIMVEMADKLELYKICIPRPGCTNGGLKWPDVKKVIEPILDDRFYITTLDGED